DVEHLGAVALQLVGDRADAVAEDGDVKLAAGLARKLLPRGDGVEAGLAQHAVLLLCDDENVHFESRSSGPGDGQGRAGRGTGRTGALGTKGPWPRCGACPPGWRRPAP